MTESNEPRQPSYELAEVAMTLDRALDQISNSVPYKPSPTYPADVNERLATVGETASANCGKVPPQVTVQVMRLLETAIRAPTTAKRVAWHLRAAEVLSGAFAPHSACKPGCNHCCHIPVKISATEARSIGKAIGRAPSPPLQHKPVTRESYNSGCVFLRDGRCTIYVHRPAVCRTHLNMDVDDLLCRLLPSGESVPVPYLDTRAIAAASLVIGPQHDPIADLRQWFPSGGSTHE